MTTANPKDFKILVVDDEAFTVSLTTRVLNRLGYEKIDTAVNGKVALEKMADSQAAYDLVICDLNMPQMDGVEFMHHIKDNNYQGGIILLSGEDRRMLETAHKLATALNLNVLGKMIKPLRPDLLEEVLASFSPPQQEKRSFIPQQAITEAELRAGIDGDGNELLLVFQPKVHIQSGEVSGVETLARWNHAERGMLGPGAFIPLAEETGLIDALSYQIYEKAVQQTSIWLAEGNYLKTSVNFSIKSFASQEFADFLISTTEAAGLNPRQLILEVTETQLMTDAQDFMDVMLQMRMRKFGLSIDDFGTGNTSIKQLEEIPFTELKIDRAFVNGASSNAESRAIIEASIQFARKLDMEVVAEGVETREDWDLVEELGVDYVQGFFVAKPLPDDELQEFQNSWHPPPSRIKS